MAGTVVAVFDDNAQAERAAQALVDDGVPLEDITLVFRGADGATGTTHDTTEPDQPMLASGAREVTQHDVERPINPQDEIIPRAAVGFLIGAPLGSLLISLLVFFQSVEGFLAAHALAGQLGSAIVGGVLGAIVAASTAGGIPVEAAKGYHSEVKQGKTLVTLLASGGDAPHLQEMLRGLGGRRLGFFPRFLDTLQSVES